MMALAGWIVALALAVMVGYAGGHVAGEDKARGAVANECRQAGSFAYKRTGFECQVKK